MEVVSVKCHSDEEIRNDGNGTGKPHERETQILVGEPNRGKTESSMGLGN